MRVSDKVVTRCPSCGRGTWSGSVEYLGGDPGREIVHGQCYICGHSEDILQPLDLVDSNGRTCPIHWVSPDREWYMFEERPNGYDPLERGYPVARKFYVGCAEFAVPISIYPDGVLAMCEYPFGQDPDDEFPPEIRRWMLSIIRG